MDLAVTQASGVNRSAGVPVPLSPCSSCQPSHHVLRACYQWAYRCACHHPALPTGMIQAPWRRAVHFWRTSLPRCAVEAWRSGLCQGDARPAIVRADEAIFTMPLPTRPETLTMAWAPPSAADAQMNAIPERSGCRVPSAPCGLRTSRSSRR